MSSQVKSSQGKSGRTSPRTRPPPPRRVPPVSRHDQYLPRGHVARDASGVSQRLKHRERLPPTPTHSHEQNLTRNIARTSVARTQGQSIHFLLFERANVAYFSIISRVRIVGKIFSASGMTSSMKKYTRERGIHTRCGWSKDESMRVLYSKISSHSFSPGIRREPLA